MEKSQILEYAVLLQSAEDVAEICGKLSKNDNTARALGLACRYRGLEYVRALVENGATFKEVRLDGVQSEYFMRNYRLSILNINGAIRRSYFTNSDPCFSDHVPLTEVAAGRKLGVLPLERRVEIMKYLCENRVRVHLNINELLFYSIMSGCKEITAVLKNAGAAFSEKRIIGLTEDGRSFEWMEFCNMIGGLSDDEYIPVIQNVIEEIGGKTLHYTDSVYWAGYDYQRKRMRIFEPEIFKFTLEHFNQKKMNKTLLMKGVIDRNNVSGIEACARNGWLKMPRKRDEMIQYAADNGKTECTAWLLEFKNRTADLAAERERAEKKLMRELNADPNSVTELKKVWGFETREDDTIIITRYKGSRGEIEVPEKIGKNVVTAIGDYVFSPNASRLRREQTEFRRNNITKITLPDSIREIGRDAFGSCMGLSEVNIPDGVTEIKEFTFGGCKSLSSITIPASVAAVGDGAFNNCQALTEIILPDGISELCKRVFAACLSLRSIRLPNSLKTIGAGAFHRCVSLKAIDIPDGVEEIGALAFADCEELETIVLPSSVKKIKNQKYTNLPPVDVFDASLNVTVIVEQKSYAEKYCKRNGIQYKYGEDTEE